MPSNPLMEFYQDKHMMEAVKTYVLNHFEVVAIERVMKRESTEALADAKEVIESAFDQLDIDLSPNKSEEVINSAR